MCMSDRRREKADEEVSESLSDICAQMLISHAQETKTQEKTVQGHN